MRESPRFSIVCLSSEEWNAPLPTNRQQIMRRAAARGHAVIFVESGEFIGRHLVRILRRPERLSLARRIVRGENVAPRITVRKALNVIPWGQRFVLANRINGWISTFVLRRAGRHLPRPIVTWLYDPRATWAVEAIGDTFGVYDCVDDYAEQAASGRNRALMAVADQRAASTARLVFTTTRALRDRHLRANASTHLVGNAADFQHFARAADRALAAPVVASLTRPVLGFAGNITPAKLDLALLTDLADRNPNRTIVLVGPAEPAVAGELRALTGRSNAVWLGPVPYEKLPRVVAAFDVGLIPYAENDYTRNVFPLKLYEYLASGKPVVATGLPELEGLEPDVVVADSVEAVEAAIEAALTLTTEQDVERRQALAADNTWEKRAERLLTLIEDELRK